MTLLVTNLKPAPAKPFRLTIEFPSPAARWSRVRCGTAPPCRLSTTARIDLKISVRGSPAGATAVPERYFYSSTEVPACVEVATLGLTKSLKSR